MRSVTRNKKEKDTQSDKTRITCIDNTNFGQRKRLFRAKQGSKNCKGAKKTLCLWLKNMRSVS